MFTPPTTRTPLKHTVNTNTAAVFSQSNFGAVSTDWKHRCKTQKNSKTQKFQKLKNPKIQKSKNLEIQKSKQDTTFFTSTESCNLFIGFLDFKIVQFLFCVDFWIFVVFGFLDACILDRWTCGYLHTRSCISAYRRCQS